MGNFRKYLTMGRERDSSPYTFFTIEKPGCLIVTKKSICLPKARYFKEELIKYLDEYNKNIVLDMSYVADIDSAGAAVIVSAEAAARKKGAHIKLEGLCERVQHLLKVTKLDGLLTSPKEYAGNNNYPK